MKKLILPIIIFCLFILARNVNAQAEQDCRKIFDRELYKCLTDANVCRDACQKETKKPDGTTYFNSGEIYSKCTKERDCDGKDSACGDQAQANFRACGKSEQKLQEAKQKTPVQAEAGDWSNPRDLIYDYLVKEAVRFDVRAPGYWEIKPEDFVVSRGAPKPEGGNIWIVESREKVWVKAKDQNEYNPFDSNTTVEPGSYVKTEVPVNFWVKGVGLVQLRPGSSGSGMFAVEEINGKISPLLLMGEMEVKYGKPIEEETQKPIDWEQIKFKVRTPNSSVTVSRTHYLVRYDEKENETTVAVLEGEVEVKPNVGKSVKVTPKDGEPGVLAVSRQLSVFKLAIVGVILVMTVGVIVWLSNRKTSR